MKFAAESSARQVLLAAASAMPESSVNRSRILATSSATGMLLLLLMMMIRESSAVELKMSGLTAAINKSLPTSPPVDFPSKTFKLAVILPFKNDFPWSKQRVGPGIEYAVDTLKIQLPDIGASLVVNYGDSHCSETLGPLKAIDMYYNKSADVFIGPSCNYAVAPIARFSPHWGIPIITGGAFVQAFSDKTQYSLLTRMSGSYAKLGQSMESLFAQYNWSIAGFVYNRNFGAKQAQGRSECYFIMEAIYTSLNEVFKKNRTDKDLWYKAFDESNPNGYNISSILMEASTVTRSKYIHYTRKTCEFTVIIWAAPYMLRGIQFVETTA
jgi:hypothetical protein